MGYEPESNKENGAGVTDLSVLVQTEVMHLLLRPFHFDETYVSQISSKDRPVSV